MRKTEKKKTSAHLLYIGPLDEYSAQDPRFSAAFTAYYRSLIEKVCLFCCFLLRFNRFVCQGAPSCFTSVLSLYRDAAKVAAIEKIVLADIESLRSSHSFAGERGSGLTEKNSVLNLFFSFRRRIKGHCDFPHLGAVFRSSGFFLLRLRLILKFDFVLFFAQHLDRLHRWTEALAFVDEALAHTPTLIDLLERRKESEFFC